MSKNTQLTTVYSAVKVNDPKLERNGQVGAYIGPAEGEDESTVRFDEADEVFPNASLQVL